MRRHLQHRSFAVLVPRRRGARGRVLALGRALGTPATPQPTADESVPVPSDDATPDLSSPSPVEPVRRAVGLPGPVGLIGAFAHAPAATATPRPTAAPSGTTIVRAYFVLGSFTGNEGLVPVLREIPETKAVATAAMRALLEGPGGAEMARGPRCTPRSRRARRCWA